MHGGQKHGRDYTSLFYFLIKKIGKSWNEIFSEVCGRLDTTEPVFWLVALHEHQRRDLFCIGESSFYPGLFVDENGILQQVNTSITIKDVNVTCRCCTHLYWRICTLDRLNNNIFYPATGAALISNESDY